MVAIEDGFEMTHGRAQGFNVDQLGNLPGLMQCVRRWITQEVARKDVDAGFGSKAMSVRGAITSDSLWYLTMSMVMMSSMKCGWPPLAS